jgi:hypothetical protein
MARVHAASSSANIDWNGDLNLTNSSLSNQDVNFDATVTSTPRILNGFNDWANIRLNQVGAVATGLLPGTGEDLIGELVGDLAAELAELAGEIEAQSLPEVAEAVSVAAQALASLNMEYNALTQGQDALTQVQDALTQVQDALTQSQDALVQAQDALTQSQDALTQDQDALTQDQDALTQSQDSQEELTFTHANEMGKSRPYQLTVCVIGNPGCSTAAPFDPNYHRVEGHFSAPPFGGFSSYQVQRKRAGAADSTFVTVGGTTSANTFVDSTELADSVFNSGLQYVYRVRGLATDGNSEWSRPSAPISPVNNQPVASADPGPFTVDNRGTLTLDVLANDSDGDSPPAFKGRRPLITQQPTSGTLTPNSDGTLTYTPPRTFSGTSLVVSFKYRADDGLSSDTPQVPLSAPSDQEITVTITVTKNK